MSKKLVWTLSSLPLLSTLILALFLSPAAKEFWSWSLAICGYSAATLLFLCLVSSPLKKSFPSIQFFFALSRRKKQTGLASFYYAFIHASSYFIKKKISTGIFPWKYLLHPVIIPAFLALIILSVLALTSDDYLIRKLGNRWKPLHRTVYIAEGCVFLHMALQSGTVLLWGCLIFIPLVVFQRLRLHPSK